MYSYQLKGYPPFNPELTFGEKKKKGTLLPYSPHLVSSTWVMSYKLSKGQAKEPHRFLTFTVGSFHFRLYLDRSYPAIFQLSKPRYPLDSQKANVKLAVMGSIPALHGICTNTVLSTAYHLVRDIPIDLWKLGLSGLSLLPLCPPKRRLCMCSIRLEVTRQGKWFSNVAVFLDRSIACSHD